MTANTPIDEVEFLRLYSQGYTPIQIAQMLDIHRATVHNVRIRLGLPRFGRAKSYSDADLTHLHHSGASDAKMAEELGIAYDTVMRARRRLGLRNNSRIDEAELIRLHALGYTRSQVSEAMGISLSAVDRARKRLKLDRFHRPSNPNPNHNGVRKYDWDAVSELSEAGFAPKDISIRTEIPKRTVERIRRNLGLSNPQNKTYTQDDRDRALAMLEDGASYNEVERSLGMKARTISRWFPGRGWSFSEAVQYRNMKNHMDRLDNPAVPNLGWRSRNGR